MIRVNVRLQSSRGILVYGEIIQKDTILESNRTEIKLPRNGNFNAKKIHKIQFSLQKLSSVTKGMEHLMIFTQIIYSEIDMCQCRMKDILNIFQKGSVFGLDDYQF